MSIKRQSIAEEYNLCAAKKIHSKIGFSRVNGTNQQIITAFSVHLALQK
jgi:hypothetical protein